MDRGRVRVVDGVRVSDGRVVNRVRVSIAGL
jgi:hypothetical protein